MATRRLRMQNKNQENVKFDPKQRIRMQTSSGWQHDGGIRIPTTTESPTRVKGTVSTVINEGSDKHANQQNTPTHHILHASHDILTWSMQKTQHSNRPSHAQQTQCPQKHAKSSTVQPTEMGWTELSIIPSHSRSEGTTIHAATITVEWNCGKWYASCLIGSTTDVGNGHTHFRKHRRQAQLHTTRVVHAPARETKRDESNDVDRTPMVSPNPTRQWQIDHGGIPTNRRDHKSQAQQGKLVQDLCSGNYTLRSNNNTGQHHPRTEIMGHMEGWVTTLVARHQAPSWQLLANLWMVHTKSLCDERHPRQTNKTSIPWHTSRPVETSRAKHNPLDLPNWEQAVHQKWQQRHRTRDNAQRHLIFQMRQKSYDSSRSPSNISTRDERRMVDFLFLQQQQQSSASFNQCDTIQEAHNTERERRRWWISLQIIGR